MPRPRAHRCVWTRVAASRTGAPRSTTASCSASGRCAWASVWRCECCGRRAAGAAASAWASRAWTPRACPCPACRPSCAPTWRSRARRGRPCCLRAARSLGTWSASGWTAAAASSPRSTPAAGSCCVRACPSAPRSGP
uniref:cDNA, FLJ92221 n=1 Tax=Homo sapiens TaxID=9606 RepID=B2R4U6_HUMAN